MKDIGIIVEHKGKESLFILMATSILANGKTIKLMGTALIIIQMELLMKVIGSMIFNMALERNHGKMVHYSKEIIQKERNMESVIIVGMMAVNILVTGMKTKLMDMVHIHG